MAHNPSIYDDHMDYVEDTDDTKMEIQFTQVEKKKKARSPSPSKYLHQSFLIKNFPITICLNSSESALDL